MDSFLDRFDVLRQRKSPVVLATVVGIEGGSSKRLGARMWITRDGETLGSLTVGGCVDGRAREEGHYVLEEGASRRIKIDLGEDGLDFGMSCAGTVDVFIQPVDLSVPGEPLVQALDRVRGAIAGDRPAVFETPLDDETEPSAILPDDAPGDPRVRALLDEVDGGCAYVPGDGERPDRLLQSFVPPRLLVVVGAAPIAEPLVRLGKLLGFRVVMIDGKSERLASSRFGDADELLYGIPSEICSRLKLDGRAAVVLTAHDYRYEVPVLKEVLRHDSAYVGFVASRRRGGAVLEFLASTGVDEAALKRVHVPVGLDIGAMSPAEIAVSILAEILAERAGATCLPLVDVPDLEDVAGDLLSHSG
jgi:xanthine dehydrogenase accessory factor